MGYVADDPPRRGPRRRRAENLPAVTAAADQITLGDYELHVEEIALDDLHFDPGNLRVHDDVNLGMIQTSLEENGAARSGFARLMPDGSTRVIAGEGTARAAKHAGFEGAVVIDIPAGLADRKLIFLRRSDLTDEQAARIGLWDNATSDTSYLDEDKIGRLALTEPHILSGILNEGEISAAAKRAESQIRGDGETFQEFEQRIKQTRRGAGAAAPVASKWMVLIDCDDEEQQLWLLQRLGSEGEGLKCRALTS